MALLETLTDTFNDAAIDPARWYASVSGTAAVAESGGYLVVTPGTNAATYGTLYSAAGYDLTGSSVVVEVVQVLDAAASTETILELRQNGNSATSYRFMVVSSPRRLIVDKSIAGSHTYPLSLTYDATAHRWWRVRHSTANDNVYFETSPDGATWTVRHNEARAIAITDLQVGLAAGNYATVAAPGSARFDNVNAAGTPGVQSGAASLTATATLAATPVGAGALLRLVRDGARLRYGSAAGTVAYLRGFNYNMQLFGNVAISPAYTSQAMTNVINWGFNAVRFIIDKANWDNDATYRAGIDAAVAHFSDVRRMYIMFCLWGSGASAGNNNMLITAPADAPAWWGRVVDAYGARPNMVWELFNEYQLGNNLWPSAADLTAWRANHQPMLDAIRAKGDNHLCLVNGTAWGKYFGPNFNSGHFLTDPIGNIAYGFHTYNNPPWGQPIQMTTVSGWNQIFAPMRGVYPIFTTEVGDMNGGPGESAGTGAYWNTFLPWAENRDGNGSLSGGGWFAWSHRWWAMGISTSPNGDPNGGYGTNLKNYMAANPSPGGTVFAVTASLTASATLAAAGQVAGGPPVGAQIAGAAALEAAATLAAAGRLALPGAASLGPSATLEAAGRVDLAAFPEPVAGAGGWVRPGGRKPARLKRGGR